MRKKFLGKARLFLLLIICGLFFSNTTTYAETTTGGQEIVSPSANSNYGDINYHLIDDELSTILSKQTKPIEFLNNLVTLNQGKTIIYKTYNDMVAGLSGMNSVATGDVNDVTYYLKNGGINVQTGAIFDLKIRFFTSDSSALYLRYMPNDPVSSIGYPSNRAKAPIIWIEQTALDNKGNAIPNLNWITSSQVLVSNEVAIFKSSEAPVLFNLSRFNPTWNTVSEPASGATQTSDGYIIMGGTGNVGWYSPYQFHPSTGWSAGTFMPNLTTATMGIGTSNYVQETSPWGITGHTGFVIPGTGFKQPYINRTNSLLEMTNLADSYASAGDHTVGIMFPPIKPNKIIQYTAIDPTTGKRTRITPDSPIDTVPSVPVKDAKFTVPTTGPSISGYTFKKLKVQDEVSTTGEGIFASGYTYIEYEYVKTGDVCIEYKDENGAALADTEVLHGGVGDSYDTTSFRKEFTGYDLVQLPTETGIYQKDPITVTYQYQRGSITLHLKQVVLEHATELTIPTKGYATINNVDKEIPEKVSPIDGQINLSFVSRISDKEASGMYKIIRNKIYDFYQVDPIIPEYYQYMGYVLTTTDVAHNESQKKQGIPIFNGKEKTEYWLTLYIQPNADSFKPYIWNYQLTKTNIKVK